MKYIKRYKSLNEVIGTTAMTPFIGCVDGGKSVIASIEKFGSYVNLVSDGNGYFKARRNYDLHKETILYYDNGIILSLDIVGDLDYDSLSSASYAKYGFDYYQQGSLVAVDIGTTVTSIKESTDTTFTSSNAKYIIMPSSVTYIETGALYGNIMIKYLGTYNQWNKINFMGDFDGLLLICNDFHNVSYKSIHNTFLGCHDDGQYTKYAFGDNLFEYNISGDLTRQSILDSMNSCDGDLFYAVIGYNVTSLKYDNNIGGVFADFPVLENIYIPDSVTNIDKESFLNCTGLCFVDLPDDLEMIGESAFRGCTNLSYINIPDIVEVIDDKAFYGCSNLSNIVIGSGVINIGESAFSGCKISTIELPDSVTIISDKAFYNCKNLKTVTYDGNEYDDRIELVTDLKENGVYVGKNAFKNTKLKNNSDDSSSLKNSKTVCIYADGSKIKYNIVGELTSSSYAKTNNGYDIVSCKIGNTVTSIGNEAFMYCSSLTKVTIPNSVTSIGDRAFYYCDITSLTIGNSVTTIGDEAFSNINVKSLIIPDSVTSIGEWAFSYNGITSLTIGNSVTTIGDNAFSYGSIKSLIIPNSVTSIGSYAFEENSIESLIYKGTMNQWNEITIAHDAFCGCGGVGVVTCIDGTISLSEWQN